MSEWQTKSSKVVYKNPWMIVHEDEVVMPNGKDGIYGYVEAASNSVYVVPIDDEGNTYLIQQKRYTTKQIRWEVPAGATDKEPYEKAAKRELLEETGLKAGHIAVLSETQAAANLTTFVGAVCLATQLTRVSDELDTSEGILAYRKLPLQEAIDMIMTGEIINGPSITSLFMGKEHLSRKANYAHR